MSGNTEANSKAFSIDWLVKGTLTKIGDILDRSFGRGWKPSSRLATSQLVDRLKALMDAEIREDENGRKYVPHNICLKMQWDKFSTDSEDSLQKLEHEFLVAAVDHINDRHYYTCAPLSITVKPDYFTSGIVLLVNFDKFDSNDAERAVNVTVDGLSVDELFPAEAETEERSMQILVSFRTGDKLIEKTINLREGERISVGRTKENDLQIDDQSISKVHASLLLNKEGKLLLADTGSTNGTFIDGQRLSYGKAAELSAGAKVMFGLVNVSIEVTGSDPEELHSSASPLGTNLNGLESGPNPESGRPNGNAPPMPDGTHKPDDNKRASDASGIGNVPAGDATVAAEVAEFRRHQPEPDTSVDDRPSPERHSKS